MANRSNKLSDNMDMLLDTMCNLFGGIIVIAILLAIITNAAKPIVTPPMADPGKFEDLQQKEIDSLTSQLAQMRALLGPVTNAVVEADIRSVLAKIEAAEKEIEKNLMQIQSAHQQVERRKVELANMCEEALRLRRQLASLVQKERTVRVPLAHKIMKAPVFAAIRCRQFYLITDMSQAYRAGTSRAYDTTFVEVRGNPANLSRTIVLRDQVGQPVRQGGELGGALQKMLANMDRSKEFISIAVYPDSYAEFNYIKGLVVARDVDYYWFPMSANDSAIEIVASDSASAL